MRILFDQGTPAPLRNALPKHHVSTAFEMGWSALSNGDLLDAGEAAGFEAFVTTDQSLRYQQVLSSRQLAILVLPYASWPRLSINLPVIEDAINRLKPGDFVELSLP